MNKLRSKNAVDRIYPPNSKLQGNASISESKKVLKRVKTFVR
ncbi:unnamed protein product [Paramecium sonneborni]|uniref:Uncharacterized protein n=1 Tax=Paramecium sonneborni TaxID=65129 RepID=A0A8S1RTD9_9CILI|nr:unnamed protein product [Paramecium sonneborni]